MLLRPYQVEAVETIWNEFRTQNDALLVLPTGAGKTAIFLALCDKALRVKPDIRIVILLNKVKLVDQTMRRASEMLPVNELGEVCGTRGNYDISKPVTVGSIQSLTRLDPGHVNLLIVDEAHRLTPDDESSFMQLIAKMREKNPNLKILGATATPFRSSGYIYGEERSLFSRVTFSRTLKWAIAEGYLVPPRLKRVENQFDAKGIRIVAGDYDMSELEELVCREPKIDAQIKDAMKRLVDRKACAWACASIKHAEIVRAKIPEPTSLVHSKMSQTERDMEIEEFESGRRRHIVFVTILSEGYDHPAVDAIILMRPTRSPVLAIQTIGRGLRIHPGKEDCLVLDYGKVIENVGPLDDPNIPKKGISKKTVQAPTMKFCPNCLEYLPMNAKSCHVCGHVFKDNRDVLANLSRRAASGNILSGGEVKTEWIAVRSAFLERHVAKSGRAGVRITYYPNEIFRLPVREYAVFDESSPWLNEKSTVKLARFGLKLSDIDKVLGVNGRFTPSRYPRFIKVKFGQFPEIEEVSYETRQRIEID